MHKKYHIRPALEADAAILCAAERRIAETPGRLVSHPDELKETAYAEKIRALADIGCYLVAEKDGVIVGHAVLEPVASRLSLAHVYTLGSMVVHSGADGQGAGSALMRALLQWAQQQPHIERIELRVREQNTAARRLYEKFGFVLEGRFDKRIKLADGSYLTDLMMAWFAPLPPASSTTPQRPA
ncbi:GNAT family N-acetyltransferase [Collimonas pratensis]|uniref:Acetyltransferase family protein n=1 Tax=Collimonas pratensis TaxID=279113 RepID=A0A127Q1G7_9BURK|nr:GNAT family N-acetyltransferase [Collimonas pratensis]AMP03675.1 acetyltransferase family protein [Collimonas pratensis]